MVYPTQIDNYNSLRTDRERLGKLLLDGVYVRIDDGAYRFFWKTKEHWEKREISL